MTPIARLLTLTLSLGWASTAMGQSLEPRMRWDVETVVGEVEASELRRTVAMNAGRLRACYAHAVNQDPSLTGDVVVVWSVDEAGESRVEGEGDLGLEAVSLCVFRVLSTVRLPASFDAGDEVRVTLHYWLEPAAQLEVPQVGTAGVSSSPS
jgi:hypothetical protein